VTVARRGNVVVALLFALLLAAGGAALLTHTGLHLEVVAARRGRRLQAAALEQALLLQLHRYRERLAASDMSAYAAPESEFFCRSGFPDASEEGFLCRHAFRPLLLSDDGGFRVTRILDLIQATDGRRRGAARAAVDLVSGDIPVGEFGLLVAQSSDLAPDAFLAAHGIEYAGALLPQVRPSPVAADARRLLADVLDLAVELPDWRRIRERFGLDPADEPIPAGIYLVRDKDGIRAAFVEGDLEKLTFAAAGLWQSIAFQGADFGEELRYRPGLGETDWSGPDGPAIAGLPFAGKIVVHGSVWGIEQGGAAAFLDGARIELLASGRLVVRTELQGEALAVGRTRLPAILLMTVGRDFLNDEDVAADVVIDIAGGSASDTAVVQAQVLSAGTLVNGRAAVEISGALCSRGIENEGTLRVGAAPGSFALDDRLIVSGCRFLRNFRVHFIEALQNEE
jgi:hypothetical protein